MKIIESWADPVNWGGSLPNPAFLVLHGSGDVVGVPFENSLSYIRSDKDIDLCYHYFISKEGDIHQLVPEHRRARHAGKSEWTEDDFTFYHLNLYSIGVAFFNSNVPGDKITTAQIKAATWLWKTKFPHIKPERILTHKDISYPRKTDPDNLTPMMQQVIREDRQIFEKLVILDVYGEDVVDGRRLIYSEVGDKLYLKFLEGHDE